MDKSTPKVLKTLSKTRAEKILIGWNEWCALPKLGIPAIKAKIDTGAKTSAIHAIDITPFTKKGVLYVRFLIDPIQNNPDILIPCTARVVDHRKVTSSNGHYEHRYVIATHLQMGTKIWEIELTLSNRDPLQYKILLGRQALAKRVLIAPHKSCCQGKHSKSSVLKMYK